MVKNNKEMLKMCSSIIMSIIITTQLDDKDKLLVVAKSMRDSAKLSSDYSESMKDAYNYVVLFLENIWRDDFKKIREIVFEK